MRGSICMITPTLHKMGLERVQNMSDFFLKLCLLDEKSKLLRKTVNVPQNTNYNIKSKPCGMVYVWSVMLKSPPQLSLRVLGKLVQHYYELWLQLECSFCWVIKSNIDTALYKYTVIITIMVWYLGIGTELGNCISIDQNSITSSGYLFTSKGTMFQYLNTLLWLWRRERVDDFPCCTRAWSTWSWVLICASRKNTA